MYFHVWIDPCICLSFYLFTQLVINVIDGLNLTWFCRNGCNCFAWCPMGWWGQGKSSWFSYRTPQGFICEYFGSENNFYLGWHCCSLPRREQCRAHGCGEWSGIWWFSYVKFNQCIYIFSDFHLLPSGIASSDCLNVIGNGVVVNLDALFSELERNGFTNNPETNWEKRLFISDCAHLVLPIHIEADGRQELKLGDKA